MDSGATRVTKEKRAARGQSVEERGEDFILPKLLLNEFKLGTHSVYSAVAVGRHLAACLTICAYHIACFLRIPECLL